MDYNSIFKGIFDGEELKPENKNYHNKLAFQAEMKTIAEERRISNKLGVVRERTRKEKLDEPFELGGAL